MAIAPSLAIALFPSCILASFINGADLSIPFENKTALSTEPVMSWVSSADRRGTGDILYSCTLTILLCIFTVLHLNIPAHGEKAWKQYLRKILWMFTALIAPEIVLYVAFTQYTQARTLCKVLNGPRKNDNNQPDGESHAPEDRPKISLSYGFFAVMGGFVVDVSKFCDYADQITLNIEDITRMARNGRYLPMREADIDDRSKANVLAKGLVCLQISWMLVQCSARKAASYPLTLLEIHTFVHVVCAVALYAFWLKKPLDVTEPTIIDPQQEEIDALALRMMRTETRHYVLPTGHQASHRLSIRWRHLNPKIASSYDPQVDQLAPNDRIVILEEDPRTQLDDSERFLESRDTGFFYVRLPPEVAASMGVPNFDPAVTYKALLGLNEKGKLRHEMAQRAINHSISPDWLGGSYSRSKDRLSRSSNAADLELDIIFRLISDEEMSPWRFILALVILTGTYGGVHLTAWHFEFASLTERWLWRSSCIYITLFATSVILIGWLAKLLIAGIFSHGWPNYHSRRKPRRRFKDGRCYYVFCILWEYTEDFRSYLSLPLVLLNVLLLTVGMLAYIFARMFLVIESFISLRHVPIGVYAAVPWANYIPHF